MKILLLADFHFGEDRNSSRYGGPDYVNVFGSQFSKYMHYLSPMLSDFDLVANLGDSINHHGYVHGLSNETYAIDLGNFKQLISYWDSSPTPVFHVLGNHDGAIIPREDFVELLGRKTYFSEDLGGFHHIILDPVWGEYPFRIDDEQMLWLKQDLTSTNLPTIVYIHTPCDESDLSDNYYHKSNPACYFVADRKQLRGLFEDSGKVVLVVQGHSHFYANRDIQGIKYLTVPSLLENDTSGVPCGEYVELEVEASDPHEFSIRRRRIRLGD